MKVHEIQGHIQSIYLVEYSDRLLLLDGCARCDIEALEAFIASLGKSMSDLKLIVVTHMHPDHAGAAQVLSRRYGIPIASSDADKDWYAGISGSVQHFIDILLAHYVANRMKKPLRWLWYSRKLKPHYRLREGQTLPFFKDWSIVETPGHTDRDVSLLHRETRTLYLADTILKVRGRFISPFPLNYPEIYRRSLEKLMELEVDEVLLAHGGRSKITWTDIEQILKALGDRPRNRDVFASIVGRLIKIS